MNAKKHQIVVSVYLTKRGLGYCVFDTPKELIDWGYCDIRFKKAKRTLDRIKVLIDLYHPEVLVLEDPSDEKFRKSDHIKKLVSVITDFAIEESVPVKHYSLESIEQLFPQGNKHSRAKEIAQVLPELEAYLPPKRNIWKSEHQRMQIFDAVSLALTFFYLET